MTQARSKLTEVVDTEAAFLADVLGAEADALRRLAQSVRADLAEQWRKAIDLLDSCAGHVVVSGMGKSGLIGAKVSATFSSLGQPSNVLHPAEAVHGDLGRVRRGDVVILLSDSGETEEVVSLATILKADGVPRLGISSNPRSSLARLCDVHLSLGDLTEACPLNLAPTTSTTAQLAIGDALALALARRRNFSEDDFQKAHPGGLLGVGLRPVTEALRFRVGDNLPVVPDTVTVGEALDQAASDRRAGAIVLVDASGRLSGIFTDADFRRLMRQHPDGMSQPIREVMTMHPAHLTVDQLVRDAVQIVRERRLDEIPVLDQDGRPVGLVDVQDLIAMKVVKD
jgi:arabinose-5-phosphate isomerase